ncbi:MAG: TIM barrel protein [Verrucomicrobiales bacterium]|nr:TIM barrel protein [Verrucomicrobiales bacterium]
MVSRRDWIKTAGLAISAGGVASAKEEGCGIAIGTYGLQSMPLAEAVQLIAKTGFNAFEITVFPGTTGDPVKFLKTQDQIHTLRDQIADSGLRLSALMGDLKPEEDDQKHVEQLSELRTMIELARALSPNDPPVIQTILGGKVWETSKFLFRDRLADWNRILADQKGYLSIKPHRSHAMGVPEDAKWLLDQLGNPRRLRMVYDYSHYAFLEPRREIPETVEVALPITNYVAVKDAVEVEGKVRFALAGESGNWDHADIIEAFYDGGYRGDFCCEVSSQIWRNDPKYSPVAATERCYQNLKSAFDRAGVTAL